MCKFVSVKQEREWSSVAELNVTFMKLVAEVGLEVNHFCNFLTNRSQNSV